MLHPGEADIRYLCDRHAGIGAGGVLRVGKAGGVREGRAGQTAWRGPPGSWRPAGPCATA